MPSNTMAPFLSLLGAQAAGNAVGNAAGQAATGALGEARFVTTGMDPGGRIIVVVYTYRDASVRLISARPATRSEKIIYEKGIRLQ